MDSIFSTVTKELSDALAGALAALKYDDEEILSTITHSKAFGDLSSSIALKIAKRTKTDPSDLSKRITASIKPPKYVSKITNENNFINFHLDRELFSQMVMDSAKADREHFVYSKQAASQKSVMIEYPSVNPNKPWHIGHLRNALIGDSLANVYAAMGYSVEREDYIDDLGIQMAEILWWYEKNELSAPTDKKFDLWLGEEYVKINAYIEGKDFKKEIETVHSNMEQNGTYESKLLRDIVSLCIKAQYKTAFDFGIYHDLLIWESDIMKVHILETALNMLKERGFAKIAGDGEYKGCTVIDLSTVKDLPPELKKLNESVKVLIRSDGTSTYLAKDIGFHMWKFGLMGEVFKYSKFIEKQPNGKVLYTTSPEGEAMKFGNADMAVNIIDTRQSHPQTILRLALASLGRENISERVKHIAYGEVELETGSLSGRKGTWLGYTADAILEEAIARAKTLISSRFDYSESERERIAKAVALSAIKFEFLKFGIEKKIVFSWERAMNFEGSSGPYHQYMHARANRIIHESKGRRAKLKISDLTEFEFSLLKLVAMGKDIVAKACREGRPNVITDYMNELSSTFSRFYELCPVLKADESKREFRILLTELFKDVSAAMLNLLGIEPLERM